MISYHQNPVLDLVSIWYDYRFWFKIAFSAISIHALTSESESESELFTGNTSKDNHSPGPMVRELVPSPHKRSKLSN